MQRRYLAVVPTVAAIVLISCGPEMPVSPPTQLTPPATAGREMFDDQGGYWEELPEEAQAWVAYGDPGAPPTGAAHYCPSPYPEPGRATVPLWLWYTVTSMNGSPIQRKVYFALPYTLVGQSTTVSGLYCGYSYTKGTSEEGDWEVTGGTLWMKSQFYRFPSVGFSGGFGKLVRLDNGRPRRVSGTAPGCDNELVDPIEYEPGGPYDSDTCTGGSDGSDPDSDPDEDIVCTQYVEEISFNDGVTWTVIDSWWECS